MSIVTVFLMRLLLGQSLVLRAIWMGWYVLCLRLWGCSWCCKIFTWDCGYYGEVARWVVEIFFWVLVEGVGTLVLVFEVGDDFLEIIFAERGKYFFLVLFADDYVAGLAGGTWLASTLSLLGVVSITSFWIIYNYSNMI